MLFAHIEGYQQMLYSALAFISEHISQNDDISGRSPELEDTAGLRDMAHYLKIECVTCGFGDSTFTIREHRNAQHNNPGTTLSSSLQIASAPGGRKVKFVILEPDLLTVCSN